MRVHTHEEIDYVERCIKQSRLDIAFVSHAYTLLGTERNKCTINMQALTYFLMLIEGSLVMDSLHLVYFLQFSSSSNASCLPAWRGGGRGAYFSPTHSLLSASPVIGVNGPE